ncbi:ankyrin repeat domain-containing protein [Ulvibacter antarcticus]|uniref:Ankyrin repeat protein n=1 Tax=Ulvibacter antarcticus TaxID=442714 RepID=A0A3L9YZ58_9FLAO|nr:ankyrin repeat domain-containing protein [Ulvibacter antarcticus]RMA64369.1 ankyrin repeat protein [Ulvibacter antarcticus]
MILLLIKTSIIIAVVLAFYKLIIEKETFYATNRFYLIAGLIFTFALPFISLPKLIENQGFVSTLIETKKASEETDQSRIFEPIPVPVSEENKSVIADLSEENLAVETTNIGPTFSWLSILFYIYIFGVIVLFLNLLSQIVNLLLKVISSKDKIRDTDGIIINSSSIKEPCSFFNYIFINPEQYEFEIYEQIIAHEKIHVKKRHSIDLMLSEIAVILLWFNPFVWLFRKEVEKNIEYQTDNHLLDNNATKKDSYQMNLLRIATYNKPLTITTNYNQSLIKQRIAMMNKKKSNPHSYWKYAFTMPLFLAIVLLLNKPNTVFAQSGQEAKQLNEVVNTNEVDDTSSEALINSANDDKVIVTSNCTKLLDAIRANDIELVKTLLKSTDANCIDPNPGYDVFTKNGHKWQSERANTPLTAAARTGNVAIAKLLIAKDADVSLVANGEGTALINAAQHGQLDFVKYMIEKGADIHRSFPNQGNALIAAAGSGNAEMVQFLVSKGMDINAYTPNQGNALITGCSSGNLEVVKFLLEKGMDINFIAPNQGNAIIAASSNGHLETVKYLISKGADIHKIAPNQGTPLIVAANNGYQNVVSFLVTKGADVNLISLNQGSAISVAANNGHMDVVKYLVSKGANVNSQSNSNGSALISAARNGMNDNVSFLIEKGADVNAQTDGSGSALIAAARNGNNSTIELLISKGADVNLENDGSGSALVAAAQNGLIDTVKLLVAKGANVNGITDGSGSSLIAASANGLHDMINLLLENGADINLQSDGSGFALHAAAKNGRLKTVQLLIEKGADVNLYNSGSGTALAAASRNGQKAVVDYLLSTGAEHIYSN